jgi:thiamine biosynthesis protein ThiS
MKLQINGDEKTFDSPLTLAGLVETLGMKADRVAVELNRDIVPRDRWSATILNEGDRLEIVHFVGGGSAAPTGTLLVTLFRQTFLAP